MSNRITLFDTEIRGRGEGENSQKGYAGIAARISTLEDKLT